MNAEEIDILLKVIDKLLIIKTILRKITPTYKLEGENKKEFTELLYEIKKDLNPLFQKFLSSKKKIENKADIQEIKKLITGFNEKNKKILVSSKTAKNFLKKMGFNPINIIVSGGPLNIEDYKELNPNLSKQALNSIKKRIQTLISKIKSLDWNDQQLIFIFENNNKSDQFILKRLNIISEITGKEVRTVSINSWKNLG